MKTSEQLTNISAALVNAQKAITFATKDATNAHFKNKYADLAAVVDAVKPALNDAGIAFIQTPSPSDDGRLHLTTRLIHSSGEWIEDTLVMPLPKQDPQGYGSAITYGRRYALASITGLYQDDDDGNAGSNVAGESSSERKSDSRRQQKNNGPQDPDEIASDAMNRMESVETVAELVKIMNGLSKEQKATANETFNRRMSELKKAA
jgi:hypothetical protein